MNAPDPDARVARLRREFRDRFGADPEVVASAPGRVNLLGEHTDYNEGFVLPMAVNLRVWAAGRRGARSMARLSSIEEPAAAEVPLPVAAPRRAWTDYPIGVWRALAAGPNPPGGFDALFTSQVPAGAGLSSSAALGMATARLLERLYRIPLPPGRAARVCQEAESFAGIRCGIMDPLASELGREGSALLLDCRSLDVQALPLPEDLVRVAVCHSGVPRALAQSPYNDRRRECEQALSALRSHLPGLRALRDVSPVDLERFGSSLPPILLRRARHVVQENQRVLRARDLLVRREGGALGKLLDASDRSLAVDFEVTGEALDALSAAARRIPGTLGSRMTGAGFGGCTVSLVEPGREETFLRAIEGAYYRPRGLAPQVWFFTPAEGARLDWAA